MALSHRKIMYMITTVSFSDDYYVTIYVLPVVGVYLCFPLFIKVCFEMYTPFCSFL